MTDTTFEDGILKTDRLGRVKTPRERREALLDEQERSGMSAQAFAAHYGIKYQTFATWVQKRRRKRAGEEVAEQPGGDLRLVEAVIERKAGREVGKAGVTVELPGGARAQVSNVQEAELVAQLLRALEGGLARPC